VGLRGFGDDDAEVVSAMIPAAAMRRSRAARPAMVKLARSGSRSGRARVASLIAIRRAW
jgi:hypothetical protein